ncbi:helix-turn-helix transcriptional regulator [Paeniglutamicibacter psychrophenolicus]|uniref:DNA-binding CsgD family transcriptional regulator n=1 Tax=Paeniglutamicibacter psychrophenolicus TaxID=257454 RepID=A0ABS4WI93_9MICC|nr:DNA-binding CsgD family transcriptional regulator [Paeniglutamicibacter psychrophenolicus]
MQINGLGTATSASPPNHDQATMPDHDFDWDVFAHYELLEETIGAVLNGPGALLEGPSGVGKRTLAKAVMRKLQDRAFIIDLEHPERHQTSMELAGKLRRLEGLGEESRYRELGVVKALLDARAGERHVMIFIPAGLRLGASSISFLSSLTLASSISLLCIADGQDSAEPGTGNDLGSTVDLQPVRLYPLTLGMTHDLLAKALGAEISRTATYQLWCASAGQIHMLAAVAHDWREQGYLEFAEKSWVVHGVAGPPGPRSRGLVVQKLRRLSTPEQRVLRFLAFSEEIPLSLLVALNPGQAVDSIFSEGILEIRGKYARKVRLRGGLSGQCIAEDTAPGIALELLEQMRNTPGADGVLTPLVLLKWEQAAGIDSGARLRMQAAEQAYAEGQVELCLQILAALDDPPLDARLLALEAAVRGGQRERAREMLSLLRHEPGTGLSAPGVPEHVHSPVDLIRLELASMALDSLRLGSPSDAFRQGVARARADIDARYSSEPGNRTDFLALRGKLDLLEAETSFRLGERLALDGAAYIHPLLGKQDQLRWQCFQNLHSVRRGEVREGVRRGRELLFSLRQESLPPAVGQSVKLHLVDLYLLCGEWKSAVELIDAAWVGGEESPRITDINGLYSSLNSVLGGRPREALELITVEIEQLRTIDTAGYLPLAIAAAAVAASYLDRETAERFLAELDVMPAVAAWESGQTVAMLRADALFHLGHVDEAIAGLLAGATASAAHGDLGLELAQRMSLLRMGHREGDTQLLECAQRIDGPVAELVAALVQSFEGSNRELQREVLSALRGLGHPSFADSIEVMFARSGSGITSAPRKTAPESAGAPMGVSARSSASSVLSLLTRRQRMIVAEAATGASNREISDRLQLKIRTVEGHLYQIYQRLNVASREALIQIFLDATSGSGVESDIGGRNT